MGDDVTTAIIMWLVIIGVTSLAVWFFRRRRSGSAVSAESEQEASPLDCSQQPGQDARANEPTMGEQEQLGTEVFAAKCAQFAGMLRTQMVLGIVPTLQSCMTRNPYGVTSFVFTQATGIMLGFMAVVALAYCMVRQKIAVRLWAVIMMLLAVLSILGRFRILTEKHQEMNVIVAVFVCLGFLVDVAVIVSAVAASKASAGRQDMVFTTPGSGAPNPPGIQRLAPWVVAALFLAFVIWRLGFAKTLWL